MWQDHFKNTYVINLPERVDRRERVASELERLGVSFEFVQAVRGRDNQFALWFFRNVLRQTASPSPGLIGCHLSHASIWIRTLLDASIAPDDFILVMEDDLKWCSQTTNEVIEALLAKVPTDANMVKFSVADWRPHVSSLEQRGQVKRVDDGVYLQTGMLAGRHADVLGPKSGTAEPHRVRLPRQLRQRDPTQHRSADSRLRWCAQCRPREIFTLVFATKATTPRT